MLPETYQKALSVINWLGSGALPGGRLATLTACCECAGLSYSAFRNLIKNDAQMRELYETALAQSEDILADRLVNINVEFPDPKMAAVVSKNVAWLLARRRRQDYGDHVTVEHTTTRDQMLLGRLRDAKERALKDVTPQAPAIEHVEEATVVVDDAEAMRLLGLS